MAKSKAENLIELLKKNEKPFGLMSEEMQEKARGIGVSSFQRWLCEDTWGTPKDHVFLGGSVYHLLADYTDEPEIVECEIVDTADGYRIYSGDGDKDMGIHVASRRKNFIGFKFLDGTVFGLPVKYSVPGMTSHGYYASYEDLKTKQALEHHATHVLFRRKKKE